MLINISVIRYVLTVVSVQTNELLRISLLDKPYLFHLTKLVNCAGDVEFLWAISFSLPEESRGKRPAEHCPFLDPFLCVPLTLKPNTGAEECFFAKCRSLSHTVVPPLWRWDHEEREALVELHQCQRMSGCVKFTRKCEFGALRHDTYNCSSTRHDDTSARVRVS